MTKKSLLIIFLFSSAFILSSFKKGSSPQQPIRTIILDPGHGGRDVGAKGQYSYEKDICLAITLKIGELISREIPEVKLIYTRTTDTYPELHERARMANQSKGDLYLCVHVNAAPPIQHREFTGYRMVTSYTGKGKKKRKVTRKVAQYRYYTTPNNTKGTETYIWGSHKNTDKEVAVRENAPMLAEENFEQNYGSIDPNSPEFIALSLLKTKQFFKRSATLAGFVEDEFFKVGRTSRGQRQRQIGIWVLQATAMPSVLVETGYITNREEEDYLNSQEGQNEISVSVVNALKNYIAWLEKQQHTPGVETNTSNTPEPRTSHTKTFLDMIENKEKSVKAR
jgi:N-acetylmuramoyl-L-alanine amidase